MREEKGAIIQAMCLDLQDDLPNRVSDVRKQTGWDEFWMLFTMREDICNPKVIRQGWVACPIAPLNIEGTLVFYVNYKKGLLEIDRVNRRVLTNEMRSLRMLANSPIDKRVKI